MAVAEPVDRHPDLALVAEKLNSAARSSAGVRISECVFLAHGAFPKTPSGKAQRFRCQELAIDPGPRNLGNSVIVTPLRTKD